MISLQTVNSGPSNRQSSFTFMSNAQIDEETQRMAEFNSQQLQPQISGLAGYFLEAKDNAVMARQTSGVDNQLLQCLRQYKGEYDPAHLQAIQKTKGSSVFVKFTGTKCRAACSIIEDIFNPFDMKIWEFRPTPQPDIDENDIASIADQVTREFITDFAMQNGIDLNTLNPEQLGQLIDMIGQENFMQRGQEMRSRIELEVFELAKATAERMQTVINDQLEDAGWRDAVSDFATDFCIFPVAYLKWEMVRIPKRKRVLTSTGYQIRRVSTVVKKLSHVSPFDIYPSPEAVNIGDYYLFERIKSTRSYLNSLKGIKGYDSNAIDFVINQYWNSGLRDTISTDQERSSIEKRPTEFSFRNESIDIWKYEGRVPGHLLAQYGYSFDIDTNGENPFTKEYFVNASLVNSTVIGLQIIPEEEAESQYFKASYVELPGSWYGISPPELMNDPQAIANASARSLVNNMGLGAGPIIGIHRDRLADGESPNGIHPFRVFQFKNPTNSTAPPIEFFQAESQAERLINVLQAMKRLADEATGIPSFTHGDTNVSGAGRTFGGLSLIMQNANMLAKKSIGNIYKGVFKPIVQHFYNFNMIHHPDASLKGDLQIVATGILGQVVKETKLIGLQTFRETTTNDIDLKIIGEKGRAEQLRQEADLIGLKNVVPSDDEIARRIEEQARQLEQQNEEMEQKQAQLLQLDVARDKDDQNFQFVKQGEELNTRRDLARMQANSLIRQALINVQGRQESGRPKEK